MNKIEEIINKVDEDFYKENSYYLSNTEPEKFAKQVAITFGKLAFDAGTKNGIKTADKRWLSTNKFIKPLLNYEDFLKEIEDEL